MYFKGQELSSKFCPYLQLTIELILKEPQLKKKKKRVWESKNSPFYKI